MIFRAHIPRPPLDQFVEMLWFYSGDEPAHSLERILPDGSSELVINLDDTSRKRFDRSNPGRFETFRRSWISGVQSEYLLIDVLPRATMIGAHFKPGGLAPLLGMPADEVANQVVEADGLWGDDSTRLRDSLLEARTVDEKFANLERFLLRQAGTQLECDSAVAAALSAFERSPTCRVRELADEFGVSHKTLIARFRSRVGLAPKQYHRIKRLQRALSGLNARSTPNAADLALAAGYYDQAHFINDFRNFTGFTPEGYLARAGPDHRFVPVGD